MSRSPVRPARRVRPAWFVLALGVVAVCWIQALARLDVDELGAYGLVSALPVVWFAALGTLTASFVVALFTDAGRRIIWSHLVAFVIFVHATPAIAYGNVRYAWAWKHIGVVDYLQRGHALWTDAPYLAVYHNWPAFFTGATTLTDATGLQSAASIAAWAPLFFELLNVLAVVLLLRALTDDRRVVWFGAWIFLLGNWVGQDYFAPQAFAYVLYLLTIAIVLQFFRAGTAPVLDRYARSALIAVVVVLCVAIATSHPLTPLVLTAALTALAVFRVVAGWWLPALSAATTLGWWVTGAREFTRSAISSAIREFGAVSSNVRTHTDLQDFGGAQRLVSAAGRGLVVLLVLLALAEAIRQWRGHRFQRPPAVLAAVPVLMLIGGSYDGEMLFRAYLFALPFLAYFAAALLSTAPSPRPSWRAPALVLGVSGALLSGFMLAHFGKDAWYHFTPVEVHAAEVVYETAPPGSLLVEGSRNYPSRFENYERFTYVSIANEPADSVAELLHDPAGKLAEWLSNPRFSGAYIIITRSQKIENDTLGPLPRGALSEIERALMSSPLFDVLVSSPDANVFTLAGAAT